MRLFFCLWLINGLLSTSAFADAIYLNSGDKVFGKIIEEHSDYVVIDMDGIELTYYRDEFSKIEKGKPPPEPEPVYEAPPIKGPAQSSVTDNSEESFLKELFILDQSLESQLGELMYVYETTDKENNKGQAMQAILSGVELIEEAKKKLNGLAAPDDLRKLKQATHNYYNSLLEMQSTVLKSLSSEGLPGEALAKAEKDMVNQEKRFFQEFQKMIRAYNVEDIYLNEEIGKRVSYAELDAANLDLHSENKALGDEVRKLIEVTKSLQNETVILLEKNKKLQEELIKVIEAELKWMNQKQKQDFLRYLRNL